MSGADYLAVILLAGFVAVTVLVDWLRGRRRVEAERERDRQLRRELRRLP